MLELVILLPQLQSAGITGIHHHKDLTLDLFASLFLVS
jgi:hypothetical protein